MILGIIDSACQQGFLYAVAVFGIVLTLRILNWPDLTVDGSFTLGGAVLATMITGGHSPWLALVIAGVGGFTAGSATFLLNRKLGISKILSGILVMLVLYSVNLRIMGRANISLLRVDTLLSQFDGRGIGDPVRLFAYMGIMAVFLLALCYFMVTRVGLFLRATGDNELMVQELGVNADWLYLLGLGISNALVAISGAIVVQSQGFADVTMGTGLIMTGIAALIIGEGILAVLSQLKGAYSRNMRQESSSVTRSIPWRAFGEFVAAALGSLAYFLVVATCLRLGLASTDLKLATGVLVIFGLAIQLQRPEMATYMRDRL